MFDMMTTMMRVVMLASLVLLFHREHLLVVDVLMAGVA